LGAKFPKHKRWKRGIANVYHFFKYLKFRALLLTAAHYWQVDTSVMPARRRRRRRMRSSRSFSGSCEECHPRIATTSKNQVLNSIYA
jgi:predicted ferric reductase